MNLYKVTVDYWETFEYEIEAKDECDAIDCAREQASNEFSGPSVSVAFISEIDENEAVDDAPIDYHLEGQIDIFGGMIKNDAKQTS
ncbi:MAG: hypothetical protein WCX81_06630 [Monoglobales bacterium]